jgi:cbb3-type cytochrome oxidase subunit 3
VKLSDVVSNAGLAGYAEVALILFLIAFVGIVIAVFRPSRKAHMDAASRLPFDDDPNGKPEEDTRS